MPYLQVYSFAPRKGTSELTFTNEGKLILLEEPFEVKTSSFFKLIEASGNTLSAALMSGLVFELLTSIKCDWSTAECDGTGWVWELDYLILIVVTDQLHNLMTEGDYRLNDAIEHSSITNTAYVG